MAKTNVCLIGCGGTGVWVAYALAKMLGPKDSLLLLDGDIVEKKNLDRQLFTKDNIGKGKAEVVCFNLPNSRCSISCERSWFTGHRDKTTCYICCADNMKARRDVLTAVGDDKKARAIICGNETVSAEAYYYEKSMGGSKYDPRIYYPNILTDTAPVELSCTASAVTDAKPQTVMANMTSAAFAMYLFDFWFNRVQKMSEEARVRRVPYIIRSTTKGVETLYIEGEQL